MTGSHRRPRKIAVRDTGGGTGSWPSHLERGIALPLPAFVFHASRAMQARRNGVSAIAEAVFMKNRG